MYTIVEMTYWWENLFSFQILFLVVRASGFLFRGLSPVKPFNEDTKRLTLSL